MTRFLTARLLTLALLATSFLSNPAAAQTPRNALHDVYVTPGFEEFFLYNPHLEPLRQDIACVVGGYAPGSYQLTRFLQGEYRGCAGFIKDRFGNNFRGAVLGMTDSLEWRAGGNNSNNLQLFTWHEVDKEHPLAGNRKKGGASMLVASGLPSGSVPGEGTLGGELIRGILVIRVASAADVERLRAAFIEFQQRINGELDDIRQRLDQVELRIDEIESDPVRFGTCLDTIDNNGDGRIDHLDPVCSPQGVYNPQLNEVGMLEPAATRTEISQSSFGVSLSGLGGRSLSDYAVPRESSTPPPSCDICGGNNNPSQNVAEPQGLVLFIGAGLTGHLHVSEAFALSGTVGGAIGWVDTPEDVFRQAFGYLGAGPTVFAGPVVLGGDISLLVGEGGVVPAITGRLTFRP